MKDLLETMPIINLAQLKRKESANVREESMNMEDSSNEESSMYEFEFSRWQNECRAIRDAFSSHQSFGSKETEDQVRNLLSILCGEYSLIVDSTNNWFELLLALLLYSPSIPIATTRSSSRRSMIPFTPGGMSSSDGNTYSQIIELVNQCMEHYPEPTKIDNILIAIINNDVVDIIRYSAIFFSFKNWWLVAHLADILLHNSFSSSALRTPSGRKTFAFLSSIREFMITEFSIGLISGFGRNGGMWETACSYLSYCPTLGKHYMQLILEKEPIDSNYKAKKLKNTCLLYNLSPTIISSIGKLLAKQKLQKGRISESIYQMSQLYFFHTESQQLNTYLAFILRIYWNILQSAFSSGSFQIFLLIL